MRDGTHAHGRAPRSDCARIPRCLLFPARGPGRSPGRARCSPRAFARPVRGKRIASTTAPPAIETESHCQSYERWSSVLVAAPRGACPGGVARGSAGFNLRGSPGRGALPSRRHCGAPTASTPSPNRPACPSLLQPAPLISPPARARARAPVRAELGAAPAVRPLMRTAAAVPATLNLSRVVEPSRSETASQSQCDKG